MDSQNQEIQTLKEYYDYAQHLMKNQRMSAEETKANLIQKGLEESKAEVFVNNIKPVSEKEINEKANRDMLFGALWCVGGLVGTIANIGYIFYGAIIFGGIQFFRGALNYKKQ